MFVSVLPWIVLFDPPLTWMLELSKPRISDADVVDEVGLLPDHDLAAVGIRVAGELGLRRRVDDRGLEDAEAQERPKHHAAREEPLVLPFVLRHVEGDRLDARGVVRRQPGLGEGDPSVRARQVVDGLAAAEVDDVRGGVDGDRLSEDSRARHPEHGDDGSRKERERGVHRRFSLCSKASYRTEGHGVARAVRRRVSPSGPAG